MSRSFLAGSLLLSLLACGDSDGAAPDAPDADTTPVAVTIPFAAKFGATPFSCGVKVPNVGNPATELTATDVRFYLSEISLIDDSGREAPVTLESNAFQGDGVALLDFENGCGTDGTPELHTKVTGTVAPGSYHKVAFTLGVPEAKNHLDIATAAAPLDVTGMYWVWLVGYKFLKVDGTVPTETARAPFFIHLGSVGCPGKPTGAPTGPCAYPNRVRYELSGFDLASKTVVANFGPALANVNLAGNTTGTAPGCMSEPTDPECIAVLPRLGVNDAAPQTVFGVE